MDKIKTYEDDVLGAGQVSEPYIQQGFESASTNAGRMGSKLGIETADSINWTVGIV
jgi:hypothetical protein